MRGAGDAGVGWYCFRGRIMVRVLYRRMCTEGTPVLVLYKRRALSEFSS